MWPFRRKIAGIDMSKYTISTTTTMRTEQSSNAMQSKLKWHVTNENKYKKYDSPDECRFSGSSNIFCSFSFASHRGLFVWSVWISNSVDKQTVLHTVRFTQTPSHPTHTQSNKHRAHRTNRWKNCQFQLFFDFTCVLNCLCLPLQFYLWLLSGQFSRSSD